MNRLAELSAAEIEAEDALRAAGAIPDVLRPPGAEAAAHARWERAHADLQAALKEPALEAGL